MRVITDPRQDFAQFYAEWRGPIERYIHSKRIFSPTLEDVAQDVFLRIWQRRDLHDVERSSLKTYLWNQVRYEVLHQHRQLALHGSREQNFEGQFVNFFTAENDGIRDIDHNGPFLYDETGFSVVECNDVLEATQKYLASLSRRFRYTTPLFRGLVHRISLGEQPVIADIARANGVSKRRMEDQRKQLLRLPVMQALRADLRAN